MYFPLSKYLIISGLMALFVQLVRCKSLLLSEQPRNDQMRNVIKKSAILLKNHLIDQASSRATTSSQVIEYNARNIVLMTLLNSVLILGGLLGSLNRPDVSGFPFKRKDFSNIKKRFWNKRRYQTTSVNNVPMHSLANIPIESIKDFNAIRTNKPMIGELFPIDFDESYARTVKSGRRRNDQVSSSLDMDNCALIIQCTDTKGKQYYPSLSELTKTAVQLLNEDIHNERRKPKVMLEKIKEMVEIEQKNNKCQWKQLCQIDSKR